MSARDRYHALVVRALQKAGWRIVQEQPIFRVGRRRLWIDLEVSNQQIAQRIFVEVKEITPEDGVEGLRNAIGQYILYRAAIKYAGLDARLLLAVSTETNQEILGEPLGKLAKDVAGLHVLVFDVMQEEVIEWSI